MKQFFISSLLIIVSFFVPLVFALPPLETHLENQYTSYCNRDTAYSSGVSDARKGLARKGDFAQICTVNREALNVAYNDGYNFGLSNQSGLIVNQPAASHPEIETQLPAAQTQPYTRPEELAPQSPSAAYSGVTSSGYGPASSDYGPSSSGYSGGRLYSQHPATGYGRAYPETRIPSEKAISSGDLSQYQPEHGLKSLIEISPSRKPKCIQTVNGQACGFNCVNSMNNVRCSAAPDQLCKGDDSGHIACGYNCIATNSAVACAAFPTDNCVTDTYGHVHCGQNCRVQGGAEAVCDIERYSP